MGKLKAIYTRAEEELLSESEIVVKDMIVALAKTMLEEESDD